MTNVTASSTRGSTSTNEPLRKKPNGYDFYFKVGEDVLTFPITPSELKIKVMVAPKPLESVCIGIGKMLESEGELLLLYNN